jgi:ribosomal protein S18 acetylase RimI-like enzyme
MALIEIAEMRSGDEPFVLEMVVLTLRSLPSLAHLSTFELEGLARLEMGQWQAGRSQTFVAWKATQRVGALWIRASGEPGAWNHSLALAVAPRFQGQGVGTRLLQHALDWSRRHAGYTLSLKVHPSNEAALRLYRRFGFEAELLEMKRRLKP